MKISIKKDIVLYDIPLHKKALKIIGSLCAIGMIFLISGIIVLFILVSNYLKTVPKLDINDLKNVSQTSYLYDINGDVITTYTDIENRTWVSIEDMPQDLLDAVVSTEDKRFYSHNGYDVKRILGAVISAVTGQDVYGGSTLTQQLIKNTVLTNEATIKRKVQEIYLASELEKQMTKDEILEAYLNIIYLGGSNYGVAAAAKDYFGIDDLSQLSRKQCAFLAGITQNPYYYDPRANYYSRNAFDRNEKRTSTVLYMMQINGKITEDEYYKAMDEKLVIQEQSYSANMYKYPHFVEYVISDVIDGFIKYRGLEDSKENRTAIENEIRNGGYRIYTTLDPQIQEAVQSSISAYNNYPKFIPSEDNPDYSTEPQAAAVVMNQHTGEVVAMVGSRNEPTIKKSFNRAIASNMPIGSIIKPLSAYGPALEVGKLSDASPVINIQSKIEGYDNKLDYPGGGVNPQGVVTMRYSLAHSLNVPVARLLCGTVGYERAREYLAAMGIDRKDISMTGSGLALGSSGINMLEVTAAYSMIANGGEYLEPRSYTMVLAPDGTVLLNADSIKASRTVFSKETAYLLTEMMKDVITEGTGTAARLERITAAGKTGTNEDNSLTFAGYTNYYTSALWVGNDHFLSFDDSISSGSTVAPLWKTYMDKIHEGYNNAEILDYNADDCNFTTVKICNVSGEIANEFCSHGTTDAMFPKGKEPTEVCDMHVQLELCADSGEIATSSCPNIQKGTFYKIYVPEDSELFTVEEEKIKGIFPNAIIGKEALNKEIANNLCQYHNGFVYEEGLVSEDTISETEEALEP